MTPSVIDIYYWTIQQRIDSKHPQLLSPINTYITRWHFRVAESRYREIESDGR